MPLHDVTEDMKEWVSLSWEQTSELDELRQICFDRK